MSKQVSILIFIDWFAPGYKAGGPIASCLNFIHLMKDDYKLFVFTSDTDLGETIPYKNIVSDTWIKSAEHGCMIYYASKNRSKAKQIRQAVKETNPDFVYLNHMFSPWFVVYPLWMKWRGQLGKVVVCPRGALYESALSVKRYKKSPFLKLFKWMNIHKIVRFHATSVREKEAILEYFPESEVLIADDLPNTLQPAFKTIVKIPEILKCVFIARIHPIKNLLFLLQVLKNVRSSITLTIIGPVEDEAYWKKCEAELRSLPSGIIVHYAGALPNHKLPSVLEDHHLFILPTKGENFGHSIFESFLAGRPVLISDQTPWLQLKQLKVGWDLPLDKPSAFTAAIEAASSWDQPTFDVWAEQAWQYARNFINNRGLKQQYLRLFS